MLESAGDQQIRPEEKEHQMITPTPSSIFTIPVAGATCTTRKSVADAIDILLLDKKRCHDALLDCQEDERVLCEGEHYDTEATKNKRQKNSLKDEISSCITTF